MKAMWAVALVAALAAGAAAPLAGQNLRTTDAGSKDAAKLRQHAMTADQATHMATGRRMWKPLAFTVQQGLGASERLAQYTKGDPKSDIRLLGSSLTGAENELSKLDHAAGANRQAVAQVRTHEQEARVHYGELVRAGGNAAAIRQHASAVQQHLAAAEAAARAGGSPPDDWEATAAAPATTMETPVLKPPAAGMRGKGKQQ